jgi:hypothetical protein
METSPARKLRAGFSFAMHAFLSESDGFAIALHAKVRSPCKRGGGSNQRVLARQRFDFDIVSRGL